jgi:hypothetical protein
VWAFREAEGRPGDEVVVSLGSGAARVDSASLELAREITHELLCSVPASPRYRRRSGCAWLPFGPRSRS